MNEGLSNSDVALLAQNDGMNGGNFLFWIFALLVLSGGGFGGFGGNGNYVTQSEMTAGLNNQQTQSALQQIALSSANNNYETARLITEQTNQMLQQNNTNLINAIQGFNQVNQNILALSSKMDECCCSIKTQMLQDRLADTQNQLNVAQNAISNANQSQYLLGQLGRFVAWSPSGSQANGTT